MPHKVFVDPDPSKIVLKRGKFLETVAERLNQGSKVFISSVDHRNVWRYKKRLKLLTGGDVDASPIAYDNIDGYLFEMTPR